MVISKNCFDEFGISFLSKQFIRCPFQDQKLTFICKRVLRKCTEETNCIFICLFAHSFICSFVHLFVCSCVCLFANLFICSSVHLFICSSVHLFICSSVQFFICSFVHLFICSFAHMLLLIAKLQTWKLPPRSNENVQPRTKSIKKCFWKLTVKSLWVGLALFDLFIQFLQTWGWFNQKIKC